jgi:uncharacterized protein YbjT (DUF2867 family)
VRIFLAGASGVVGVRLLPLLVGAGHVVAGMTRSAAGAEVVRGLGAQPVICDAFDSTSLRDAVVAFHPDAVVHQLTDLPDDPARIPDLGAANNRMRLEGTANLLTLLPTLSSAPATERRSNTSVISRWVKADSIATARAWAAAVGRAGISVANNAPPRRADHGSDQIRV